MEEVKASSEGESDLPPSQTYYNYMEVFLADRYRTFRLLKPMTSEEALTYGRIQLVSGFFQEGCLIKSVVMGAGGGVLGLLFGTFFFTMRPVDIDTTQPFRKQISQSYRGFGAEITKSVKGFAKIGFMYSLCDCAIAKVSTAFLCLIKCVCQHRAKQDLYTAIYAGCATGAALGWKG